MKLQDLPNLASCTLPTSQPYYRIQRTAAAPGAASVGHLKMAPPGVMNGRFSLASTLTCYVAETPETAVYESLVRRETVSLSISTAAARQLLCLRATRTIQLLDLRPHASSWPVLQSLRFSSTQQIAAEALAKGFAGVAYRSAQHYGQDCFVVFGSFIKRLELVWCEPLLMPDGTMHKALFAAIRGGQITVTP